MAGVSRHFGLVQALVDVSLECRYGKVLAILGEKGAGKTTLMRILAGLDQADSGHLLRRAEPYRPRSPRDAVTAGFTLVQQHFALVPTMTAAENILLFRSRREVRTTREKATSDLRALASRLGFTIDPNTPVGEMSVGERTAAGLACEMVGKQVQDAHRTTKDIGAPRLVVEELEAVLIGSSRHLAGQAHFDGVGLTEIHPKRRIALNIAYTPSDRNRTALVGPMRCDENLLLGRTTLLTRRHGEAQSLLDEWSVIGLPTPAANALSGGNAQKLVAVADRIMVMFSGRIAGEFQPPFDRTAIGLATAGMA